MESKNNFENLKKELLSKENKPYTITIISLSVIAFLLFVLLESTNNESSSSQVTHSKPQLTESIQRSLCEKYIAKQFGRSASSMSSEVITQDSAGIFIKISYRRPSDNSKWDNVCHIDNSNNIVWAALEPSGPGRWRYEDDAKIIYSNGSYNIRY